MWINSRQVWLDQLYASLSGLWSENLGVLLSRWPLSAVLAVVPLSSPVSPEEALPFTPVVNAGEEVSGDPSLETLPIRLLYIVSAWAIMLAGFETALGSNIVVPCETTESTEKKRREEKERKFNRNNWASIYLHVMIKSYVLHLLGNITEGLDILLSNSQTCCLQHKCKILIPNSFFILCIFMYIQLLCTSHPLEDTKLNRISPFRHLFNFLREQEKETFSFNIEVS